MALLNLPPRSGRRPLEGLLTPREFGRLGATLVGTAGVLGLVCLGITGIDPDGMAGSSFHPSAMWIMSVVTVGAGLFLVRFSSHLYPRYAAHTMAVLTVGITVTAYEAGAGQSPFITIFYVWVTVAFVLLPERAAVAQIAFVGLCDAVLLAIQPHHESVLSEWIFTFGVTAMSGWFVHRVVAMLLSLARAERSARAEVEGGNAALEALSARETAFLTRVSHEVRTPLNAIIGFADMLGDGMVGPLNDQQSDYVGEVRNSGRHLLELIGDVVDVAKVEQGADDFRLGPCDVEGLLASAVALFRPDAERRGVHLDLVTQRGLEPITCDERKVRQVVLNLLSNAVKFTGPGGSVTVTAGGDEARLVVEVLDTGSGIAPEDVDRIFEEYRQTPGGAAQGAGTGLGLPLARRFAEQHGGSLEVRSVSGEGSAFTLHLPVHPLAPAASDQVAAAPSVLAARGSRWRQPLEHPELRSWITPLPPILGFAAIVLGGLTVAVKAIYPPHPLPHDYHPLALLGLAGVAGFSAATVALRPRLLSTRGMSVFLGGATLGFTLCDYAVGVRDQPFGAMLYVWVGLAVASCLSRRAALLHVILIGVLYGVLVGVQPGNTDAVSRWLIVMTVVVASTASIDTLLGRVGALADAERDARVQLEGVRAGLEAARRHKTQFLATMSHELRTPLNAIIGFSEVLEDELFGPLSEKQREYVRDLAEAGRQLLALVNDVLDLVKVDAGRMEIGISEDVDIAEALRGACASAASLVPVHIDSGAGLRAVDVDERKFRRIVANLVAEEAAVAPYARVTVTAAVGEDRLTVEVVHEGTGRARTSPHLPGGGGPPLRVGVAAAFAQLHGGAVDPIARGWRLTLPVRAARAAEPEEREPV